MDTQAAVADIDVVMRIQENPGSLPSSEQIAEWMTRIHACVYRYSPPGSTYRAQVDRFLESGITTIVGKWPHVYMRGVLSALRADLLAGSLSRFEELIRADTYGDLLTQGEVLHRDGYSRAGAVIAGAALEDHLRSLAMKHGTGAQLPSGPKKASAINNELKSAHVYSETQRALVESWQKLRNDAAHGKPGFEGTDTSHVANVQPMIDGIRAFVTAYPA